jgi:hypothetical protein
MEDIQLNFEHKPAAHCENGVIKNMLNFYGYDLSEPMILGLSSGLFFTHIPFIKLAGMGVTTFRSFPGIFFSRIMKILGFKRTTKRYLNKNRAMRKLDQVLATGKPVACVVGMYYLPYMPIEYRFHFNGHNICVCGRKNDEYLISDANISDMAEISRKDLERVRFAKGGTYPLFGQMYWVDAAPEQLPDLAPHIRKAIKKTCWYMISPPKFLFCFGVNGIYYLSKKIRNWEKKMGKRKAGLNLAQLVRMLEEIGTGGAGFRYMYAAFLQEAAPIANIPELKELSIQMTQVGDLWREFAYKAARIFKKRQGEQYTYNELADILWDIATKEEKIFKELKKVV